MNKLDDKVLILLGKLAVAHSVSQDAFTELQELIDLQRWEKINYDEHTAQKLEIIQNSLNYGCLMIADASDGISIEFLVNSRKQVD